MYSKFLDNLIILKILTLIVLSMFLFSNCSQKTEIAEQISETQIETNQNVKDKPCKTEPLFSVIPDDSKSENMRAAWKKFTADGKYRLACEKDGDFSLDAKEPKTNESYSRKRQSRSITNWGDWNYSKRVYEDHLAAIVVDTIRNDLERFGLVVFSPPKDKKDGYDINWLYKNVDLSRTSVGMASGSVWVEDFTPNGERSLCWIVWNRKQKVFECKNTSR